LAPSKKSDNRLLWIVLLLFLGLPLLTMLIAFILYVMVMGFG
jgi:flagellar basal body-associated protein FliL